jgi:patatin-like phospholipase/acyl hydrolase
MLDMNVVKKNQQESIKAVLKLAKIHFGKNLTDVVVDPDELTGDFTISCLVYKSFTVHFYLGETFYRETYMDGQGLFGVSVLLGNRSTNAELLFDLGLEKDELSISFKLETVVENIEAIDRQMQWRMSESQKKYFGLS